MSILERLTKIKKYIDDGCENNGMYLSADKCNEIYKAVADATIAIMSMKRVVDSASNLVDFWNKEGKYNDQQGSSERTERVNP